MTLLWWWCVVVVVGSSIPSLHAQLTQRDIVERYMGLLAWVLVTGPLLLLLWLVRP